MKRIVLFGLLLPLLSSGQILVDVPLSDGVLPATWQNVDVDGFAAVVSWLSSQFLSRYSYLLLSFEGPTGVVEGSR